MGNLNHLYCAHHSCTVIPGYWISICGEFCTVPRRLATVSTWSDPCLLCESGMKAHRDNGITCLVVCMGFVEESETQR